jgi:hypothetical protein
MGFGGARIEKKCYILVELLCFVLTIVVLDYEVNSFHLYLNIYKAAYIAVFITVHNGLKQKIALKF